MKDEHVGKDSRHTHSMSDKTKHSSSKPTKRNTVGSTATSEKRLKPHESTSTYQSHKSDKMNADKSNSKVEKRKTTYYSSTSHTSKKSHNGENESSHKKNSSSSKYSSYKTQSTYSSHGVKSNYSEKDGYNGRTKRNTSFYETVTELSLNKHKTLKKKLLSSNSDSSTDEMVDLDDELFRDILHRELETTKTKIIKNVSSPNGTSTIMRSPNEDSTIMQSLNEDSTIMRSPNEDSTIMQSPNEDSTIMQSLNDTETLLQSPNDTETLLQSLNNNATLLQSPNETETTIRSPNETETIIRSPNDTATIIRSPNETATTIRSPKMASKMPPPGSPPPPPPGSSPPPPPPGSPPPLSSLPPPPPPPPIIQTNVKSSDSTLVNTIERAESSRECSDMDISEVSSQTPEDNEQEDQLYLQSLAQPLRIVPVNNINNANVNSGGMAPNMMPPHFGTSFVPPPYAPPGPSFMPMAHQPILPYNNNNFNYPQTMNNNQPINPPYVTHPMSGGHHQYVSTTNPVAIPPHHINHLNHINSMNLNYPNQYNNYGMAPPQLQPIQRQPPPQPIQRQTQPQPIQRQTQPIQRQTQPIQRQTQPQLQPIQRQPPPQLQPIQRQPHPPPQPHVNAHVNANIKAHVNPHVNVNVNPHVNVNVNPHVNAHVNANVNAHVNANVNAHVNANVNPHVNVNVNAHVNAHVNPHVNYHPANQQNKYDIHAPPPPPNHTQFSQTPNNSVVTTQYATTEVFQKNTYVNLRPPPLSTNYTPSPVVEANEPILPPPNYIESHAEVVSPQKRPPSPPPPPPPPQKSFFELLPQVAKDYIKATYADSDILKEVAAEKIYRDYHEHWCGISKIWGERSLDSYRVLCQVGEGTYGKVYRSKDLFRDEIVALKKVRNVINQEGFPITAVREIKILRKLCHPNVVKLRDVISNKSDVADFLSSPGAFYLVFEYMEHDLLGVLGSSAVTFSIPQIQSLFKQLMQALNYCHNQNFLHRDLKCSNILLNNKGILKLADFGMARLYESECRPYTNQVITLWYRPPELLFGQERYGPYVDIWSAGCILGELFTKRPILPGNKEVVQLDRIFKLCGSPTLKSWPDIIHLPLYQMMKPSVIYPRNLRNHFQFLPEQAIDLMDKMLQLDPHKRISALEVLESSFLININPAEIEPPKFPESEHFHELLYKQRAKLKRAQHQKNKTGSNNNEKTDTKNHQSSQSTISHGKDGNYSQRHRN